MNTKEITRMDIMEFFNLLDSINSANKEYRLHNDFLVKANTLLLDTLDSIANHLLAIDENLQNMSNVELVMHIYKIKGAIDETKDTYDEQEQEFFGDYLAMEHELED